MANSIVVLSDAISIVILGIATLIAVLEDLVNLEDLLLGELQVAYLGTHCSRDTDTVVLMDTLPTGIRHMGINHTGINHTDISVLIKKENTQSNGLSVALRVFFYPTVRITMKTKKREISPVVISWTSCGQTRPINFDKL